MSVAVISSLMMVTAAQSAYAASCTAHASVTQLNNTQAAAGNYDTCDFFADQIHVTVSLWWSNNPSGPWTKLGGGNSGNCYSVPIGGACGITTANQTLPKDPCKYSYYLRGTGDGWALTTSGKTINVPVNQYVTPAGCFM